MRPRHAAPAALMLAIAACAGPLDVRDLAPAAEQPRPPGAEVDTDGDTIPDVVEGWPDLDSDGDGTPDYLDLDADDNGIPDRVEGLGDADGDGIPDYADLDDDNDRIPDVVEIGDGPEPRDTDGDGTPDFRDIDSDGDFLLDRTERGGANDTDSDGDGIVDYLDLDSDGDGWTDAEEAGDADLETPPVDTDQDGLPDYLDVDSDSDGLLDELERELGTDPTLEDSDGDGVADRIEVGAGTDPGDAADNPRVRGDFVFTVPFRQPADPSLDTIRFRTEVTRLDAYFLLDRTASMAPELSTLRSQLSAVLEGLACERTETACTGDLGCAEGQRCYEGLCLEDPATTACVPDVEAGVGSFGGGTGSFRHHHAITDDFDAVRDAVPVETAADGAEALVEAAECVADPSACLAALCEDAGEDAGGDEHRVGCPAFRRDAIRLVVVVTDAADGCPAEGEGACGVSIGDARSRLAASGIRVLGVDVDPGRAPRVDLERLASEDTGGQPFYIEAADATLVADLDAGLRRVTTGTPMFVEIEAVDATEDDDGDALQFIQRLEVDVTSFGCSDPGAFADLNADGFDDAFVDLEPGVAVCWTLLPRSNERVREACEVQVFQAGLRVFGDGVPLDERAVLFLVPPSRILLGPDDPRDPCSPLAPP